jgi:hypothetical protein
MANPWFFEVLPYRPAPYPGECLSGYLLRLGEINGFVNLGDWISDLFPAWRKFNRIAQLRWEYPVDQWGRIPLRTQLSVLDLRRLTVAPWLEKFRAPLDLSRAPSLSPGHFLRNAVNPDLQVCPLCLQEQPYVRLIWRLLPIQACLQHGTVLQARCPQCGAALTVLVQTQHHLRCAACDLDLRTLPAVKATDDLLLAQRRRSVDLQFLLDSEALLTQPARGEAADLKVALPRAIGLKFRYLRFQTGRSVVDMAHQVGVREGLLSALELGYQVPLPLYLDYLEVLSVSWPDFAALEVPANFEHTLEESRHLQLRHCPNPDCPNSQAPSQRVGLLRDVPEQQMARFRCRTCGRRFTRGYDGELRFRPRKPPIRPGEPPPMHKSAEEIACLKEMGLRGEPNRRIAQYLGWSEKTVRIHWISFGLEEQVHQAQTQRRAQVKQLRDAACRVRVEAIVQTLLDQNEEITLGRVGRALGYGSQYLQSFPEIAEWVQDVARPHNAQIRQQRTEVLKSHVLQILADLKSNSQPMSIQEITRQLAVSYGYLQDYHPELLTMIRQASSEQLARIRAAHIQTISAQINEAASRLAARGIRLNYQAILKESGLSRYKAQCDPIVHDVLQQWVGSFSPND